MALDKLKDLAEDLTSLEVTTLTNTNNATISLNAELPAPNPLTQEYVTLSTLKSDVISAINPDGAPANNQDELIEQAKEAVKAQEKKIRDMEKALGVYDPKDIFSRIRKQLGTNEDVQLVAYSRFEIEGDSVNYINNNETVKNLVESHGKLVEASQQSRQALFEMVRKWF